MKNSDRNLLHSFMQMIFILFLLCFTTRVEASLHNKIPGFYVFGDSTVDPGNNNYIKTLFRSNFPPYGKDFSNQVPTGRFTNGKLATDYIASYVGLKKELLPAYLDPKANTNIEELMTGVSFASAGSGFDPLTPAITSVIPIPKQLEYLRELKNKLENVIGKESTENHIKKAVYFCSAGTNDFALNYFTLPMRRKSYTLLGYQQFLIQHVKEFLQGLLAEGAQKIVIAGVPPMGCLPFMITLHSPNAFMQRDCIDKYSSAARDYNLLLQNELHKMQLQLKSSNPNVKLYYIDIYGPLANMVQAHQKYGFEDINSGCCGSGYIEASVLCNKVSNVCSDPSKYMFWDSIHPTEKAYHNLFLAFHEDSLRSDELNLSVLKEARIFHFNSEVLTSPSMESTLFKAIKWSKKFGGLVFFDLNLPLPLWRSRDETREIIKKAWQEADIIEVSRTELEFLLDEEHYERKRNYKPQYYAEDYEQTKNRQEYYHYTAEEISPLWHDGLKFLFVTDGTIRIHYYTPSFDGVVVGTEDVLITPYTCDRTGSGDAIVAAIMRKLTTCPEMFEDQDVLERQLRFAIAAGIISQWTIGGVRGFPTESATQNLKEQVYVPSMW